MYTYPLKLQGPTLVTSCNRDCDVLEMESKGPDSRMKVKGLGFRVQGLGFGVQG